MKKIVIDTKSNRILEKLDLKVDRDLEYVDEREDIFVINDDEIDDDFDNLSIGDTILDGKLQEQTLYYKYIYRLEKSKIFKGQKIIINQRTFRFDDELTKAEEKELEESTDMTIIERTSNSDVLGEIASGRTQAGDAYISDERKEFLKHANDILYGEERLINKKRSIPKWKR